MICLYVCSINDYCSVLPLCTDGAEGDKNNKKELFWCQLLFSIPFRLAMRTKRDYCQRLPPPRNIATTTTQSHINGVECARGSFSLCFDIFAIA